MNIIIRFSLVAVSRFCMVSIVIGIARRFIHQTVGLWTRTLVRVADRNSIQIAQQHRRSRVDPEPRSAQTSERLPTAREQKCDALGNQVSRVYRTLHIVNVAPPSKRSSTSSTSTTAHLSARPLQRTTRSTWRMPRVQN